MSFRFLQSVLSGARPLLARVAAQSRGIVSLPGRTSGPQVFVRSMMQSSSRQATQLQMPITRISAPLRSTVGNWTQARGIMTQAGMRIQQSGRLPRALLRQFARFSSNFERDHLTRPRSWTAVGGLILAGGIVLWAASGWIIAIFSTAVKILFYGAVTAAVIVFAYRFGSRMWRRAYGSVPPWEGAASLVRSIIPSTQTVTTLLGRSVEYSFKGLAEVFRMLPRLFRTMTEAAATGAQRVQPLLSAAVQQMSADPRVHAVLGQPPYEIGRPVSMEYVNDSSSGERASVRFEVVGPRASGMCYAVGTLGRGGVEDIAFDTLQVEVGSTRVTVNVKRGGRVIDVDDYEVKDK